MALPTPAIVKVTVPPFQFDNEKKREIGFLPDQKIYRGGAL